MEVFLSMYSLLAVFFIACIPYLAVQSFILAKNAQMILGEDKPSLLAWKQQSGHKEKTISFVVYPHCLKIKSRVLHSNM